MESMLLSRNAVTKLQVIVIAVVIIVAAIGGTAYYLLLPAPSPSTTIKLGIVVPLSGSVAANGISAREACELAVDEINEQGGIKSLGGMKLELIAADSRADPAVASSEAERLINSYDLTAFVGLCISANTIAVTAMGERYSVPSVVTSLSDTIYTRGYKYVFGCFPLASRTGEVTFRQIDEIQQNKSTSFTKVALVYEDTALGTSSIVGFRSSASKYNWTIVLDEAYAYGSPDLSPLVAKIKNSGAEFLIQIGYITDSVLLLRTMKQFDVNIQYYLGGAQLDDFARILGNDSEYTILTGYFPYDSPAQQIVTMKEEFHKRYGHSFDDFSTGYFCVYILKDALERAASLNRTAIRNALSETNLPFLAPGIYIPGGVKYDGRGANTQATLVVYQWRDLDRCTVWPPEAASKKIVWPIPPWSAR